MIVIVQGKWHSIALLPDLQAVGWWVLLKLRARPNDLTTEAPPKSRFASGTCRQSSCSSWRYRPPEKSTVFPNQMVRVSMMVLVWVWVSMQIVCKHTGCYIVEWTTQETCHWDYLQIRTSNTFKVADQSMLCTALSVPCTLQDASK